MLEFGITLAIVLLISQGAIFYSLNSVNSTLKDMNAKRKARSEQQRKSKAKVKAESAPSREVKEAPKPKQERVVPVNDLADIDDFSGSDFDDLADEDFNELEDELDKRFK